MPRTRRHPFTLGLLMMFAAASAWPQSSPAPAASGAAKKPHAASSAASAAKAATPAKRQAPAHTAASANWAAQLAACKNDAGMNLVKREKCVYAHCKGHWGEGECPPGQDMPTKDSFKNPFKKGAS